MNKRIEELAVSSGIYDSLCDPYDALKNGDYYSSIKIDLEKFAELIVKECCQYLENEAERLYGLSASEVDPLFQSNYELCAFKCYDNSQGLKDNFGVE